MLTACVCEPLLTGLGAGGYMLVIEPGDEPVVLDFFVEAPGRGADSLKRERLIPVTISFGDATQVFNIGPASVGTYGVPAGIAHASERFGVLPLAALTAPAAVLARAGVPLEAQQAYVVEILGDLVTSTPESAALFAPSGRLLGVGDVMRQPELADTLELFGAEGAAPFYGGAVAHAIVEWLSARGGLVTHADLESYHVIERDPVRVRYRGHDVLTNPPPNAGGILIAYALSALDGVSSPPTVGALLDVMERTQARRTSEFLEGLTEPGFTEQFLHGEDPERGHSGVTGPLGSTTHIAVIDADGRACSVTTSNGTSSGVVVPGTGIHLNNMLGEQDLNPLGFHRHPPGRRLPSMMAPTAVLRDGVPELVLGSAGSSRIRSAIVQTIIRVVDDGMHVEDAVNAARVHYEDGIVYAEPGIEPTEIGPTEHGIAPFGSATCSSVGCRRPSAIRTGTCGDAGDPRRGGVAIVAER